MSKSTGHVIDLIEALEMYPPQAVRLFYLRTHYRKPLDFSEEAMADAIASLERLWSFRRRRPGPVEDPADPATLDRVQALMDDDFDTAGALGVLFETVREGNRRLDGSEDVEGLVAAYDEIVALLGLAEASQGLDDIADGLRRLGDECGVAEDELGALVDALLDVRAAAREARDWAKADAIRDGLGGLGIAIEDVRDGARWHRR